MTDGPAGSDDRRFDHDHDQGANPQNLRVFEWMDRQAIRTPDAVAVRVEGDSLTYRDLSVRSNQLAHHLLAAGVRLDDVVGVLARRSLDMVVALFGTMKAGGAYLPLDPDDPAERLAAIVSDAGARTVVNATAGAPPVTGTTILDLADPAISAHSTATPGVRVDADNLAYVIFTSGSTGRPKGAMLTHGGLLNRLQWMQETFSLDASDVVVHKTPFTFDVSVWELFWPFMTGASLVVARPDGHRDPAYIAELIATANATTVHFVPSMLRSFLDTPEAGRCQSLRRIVCSGEALTAPLRNRTFEVLGAELHNLYGPTEATIDVSWWACRREDASDVIPIGHAIANTRLTILDDDQRRAPTGQVGQLYISGVQLARGYARRPDLTAERFLPDGFGGPGERTYRTGDLARQRDDGAIEFLGRADHQVKLRGYRIELGEIEAALEHHEGIRDAVVMVRERAPGDARLVAYVTGPAAQRRDELLAHLSRSLPDYMVPSAFVALDAMPTTASGKADRKALPEPSWDRVAARSEYEAPQTDHERAIASIWSDMLGVDRIGRSDRFFALGGHSIMATQVVTRIIAEHGVTLPVRTFLKSPTLVEAAAALGEALSDPLRRETERRSRIPRRAQPDRAPLTPAQETIWVHEQVLTQILGKVHGYHECPVLHIDGPLRQPLLERALNELAIRNETWRTSFVQGEADAEQRVAPTVRIPVRLHDCSGVDQERRGAEIVSVATSLATRPFDLGKAPLVRAALLRFSPDRHSLVMLVHHLITDAWSEALVANELARLYALLATGESLPPPDESSVQYGDYAAWERARPEAEREATRAFWKARFPHPPEALTLPAEWGGEQGPGQRVTRTLEPELSRALVAYCRSNNRSISAVLNAVLAAALSRFAPSKRFVLGLGNANRNADNDRIVGCFSGALPLSVDTSDDPTFEVLVARLSASIADTVPHTSIPLPEISRLAGTRRGAPFLQVQASTQLPTRSVRAANVTFRQDYVAINDAKFELELVVQEQEDGQVSLLWIPDPSKFRRGFAERFAGVFESTLRRALRQPGAVMSVVVPT